MDIVDILLLIVVIAGPILVFMVAWQYRVISSFVPLAIFVIIWTLWLFFGTVVPFDFVSPLLFFVIAVGALGVAWLAGAYLRWSTELKDCNPNISDCRL